MHILLKWKFTPSKAEKPPCGILEEKEEKHKQHSEELLREKLKIKGVY